MSRFLSKILSPDEIQSLEDNIIEDAEAGREEAAWNKLQQLRKAQQHQDDAAMSLLRIIDQQYFPIEEVVDVLSEIAQSYHEDVDVLAMLGGCLEAARDIDDLNVPPPDDEVFFTVVENSLQLPKTAKVFPKRKR